MKTVPVRIREDQQTELEEIAAIMPIRSDVSRLVESAVDWFIQNHGPVYRAHAEKVRGELAQMQRQAVVVEITR